MKNKKKHEAKNGVPEPTYKKSEFLELIPSFFTKISGLPGNTDILRRLKKKCAKMNLVFVGEIALRSETSLYLERGVGVRILAQMERIVEGHGLEFGVRLSGTQYRIFWQVRNTLATYDKSRFE